MEPTSVGNSELLLIKLELLSLLVEGKSTEKSTFSARYFAMH